MREPKDYSEAFAEHLRELGAEVALIGALAAIEYRRSGRETTDVDFLVASLGDLPSRLEAEGYEVKSMTEPGAVSPYLALVRGHGVRVDLMAAETPFQRSALERAVNGTISVEDVLVFKLLAWRPRDRDDVRSILEAGHALDEDYIDLWVREWGVVDRWQAARADAGA